MFVVVTVWLHQQESSSKEIRTVFNPRINEVLVHTGRRMKCVPMLR